MSAKDKTPFLRFIPKYVYAGNVPLKVKAVWFSKRDGLQIIGHDYDGVDRSKIFDIPTKDIVHIETFKDQIRPEKLEHLYFLLSSNYGLNQPTIRPNDSFNPN